MINTKKLQLAWKYRKYLWKYRALVRHRWDIAAVAATGVLIAALALAGGSSSRGAASNG
ncbi:MAG: hypothetical protein LAP87_25000 [Acidobacteriia bacterium]|nr:hypothetical protein [Terriglobia bacterium]